MMNYYKNNFDRKW